MRILLVLISLTLFGCTEDVNWENLEKVYFFEKVPENFETREYDELIQLPEAKELNIDIVKKRLKNSNYEGKKYLWKGGSFYGIAVFSGGGGERIKLKMSMNYGVYQDMNTGNYYSIEGFETLGSMDWEEL